MDPLFPWIYMSHLCAVRHHFYFLCLNIGSNHHLRSAFQVSRLCGVGFKKNPQPPLPLCNCYDWDERSNWKWVKLPLKSWHTPTEGEKQNKNKSEHLKVNIMLLIFWIRKVLFALSVTMAYHELIRQTVPLLCDFQIYSQGILLCTSSNCSVHYVQPLNILQVKGWVQ